MCREHECLAGFSPECRPCRLGRSAAVQSGAYVRADVMAGLKVALCLSSRNVQAANELVQRAGLVNDKSYFSLPTQDIGKELLSHSRKKAVVNVGGKEHLVCLAVLVADVPLSSVRDSCWGQKYTCTTDSVLHYGKPEKAVWNWLAFVKDVKVCGKLFNEVFS